MQMTLNLAQMYKNFPKLVQKFSSILLTSELFGIHVTKILEMVCERKPFTKFDVAIIFLFNFFLIGR